MKKYNKLYVLLICFAICFLGISGCSIFNLRTTKTLSSPEIGMNIYEKELSWFTINNADKYIIYMNGDAVDIQANNKNLSEQTYKFESKLTEFGTYTFSVVARAENYNDSLKSNELKYVYANATLTSTVEDYKMVYNQNLAPNEIMLTNNICEWNAVNGVDKYVVSTYTNSNKVVNYVVGANENSFNFSNVTTEKEIVAFRVGATYVSDDRLYFKNEDLYFYNPISSGEFSEDIYIFDGIVNDHYIESIEELNNVIYYHFIYRDEDYNIRISEECAVEIASVSSKRGTYGQTAPASNSQILNAINNSFNSFVETCHYDNGKYGSNFASRVGFNSYDYNISIKFYGVKECDINLYSKDYGVAEYTQYKSDNPYYETYNFVNKRSEAYDNFVSDDYFLTTEVDTTEQLYWAVENRITPICKSGSRSEIIYNKAKEVLREIVSDDMTDYEKALSIYDWICCNTCYDNANLATIFASDKTAYYTRFCCYYLEGVFIQHVAVCDGFSKAYSLLCNMEGIECIRIAGQAGTGLHAWNKVKVDGNYYVCDITWTEIKTNADKNEYLVHKYFLVNDNFISTTHTAWEARDKFSKYPTALKNYDYYSATTYNYTNYKNEDVTVDLVIESDEDLKETLYYFLTSDLKSADLVFDKDYVSDLKSKTGISDISTLILQQAVKKQKFVTQMFNTVYDANEFNYGDSNIGYVIYLAFNLMIDEKPELETLIRYLVDYSDIDNSIKTDNYLLFIDEEILKSFNKETIQEDADEYLKNYDLAGVAELEYLKVSEVMTFDKAITLHKFILKFKETAKALDAPLVELNEGEQTVVINNVDGAELYDIYINDVYVKTIEKGEKKSYFNYSENLEDAGIYNIKVYASSSNSNVLRSGASNVLEVVAGKGIATSSQTNFTFTENLEQEDLNLEYASIRNGLITWDAKEDDDYILALYLDDNTMHYYNVSSNVVDLNELNIDGVMAVRVGVLNKLNLNEIVFYDTKTLLFSTAEAYNQAYLFDGQLNDHYIESKDELNNVVYYHFINRDATYDIKLSDEFVETLKQGSQETDEEKICLKAIKDALLYFCETSHYQEGKYKPNVADAKDSANREYNISLDYYNIQECNLALDYSNYTYNQAEYYSTFYEEFISEVDARDASYTYLSDTYFLTTKVSTSEQLYWAVENKVTPDCEDGSRAEIIYNKAKEVLNSIIRDDMTDYEKALSIFEWICINTCYDYSNAETLFLNNNIYYTENCSYYLEGVFIKGVAVCDGFSKAYSLLCNMEGIDCIRVTGNSGSGLHAWNKVKINGNYYCVDITWTETLYNQTKTALERAEVLSHKYFLVADSCFTNRNEWEARQDKYSKYKADNNYQYYVLDSHTFIDGEGNEKTVNMIADSKESLKNILDYGVSTQVKSADCIVDWNFIQSLVEERQLTENIASSDWKNIFCQCATKLKLCSEYVILYFDETKYYYDTTHYGYVMCMEYRLVINEVAKEVEGKNEPVNEFEATLEYLKNVALIDAKMKNKMVTLYIDMNMLPASDKSVQERINDYLESFGFEDDFNLVVKSKTVQFSGDFDNAYLQVVELTFK